MARRCFNCGEQPSGEYTVVLDSGAVLEDKPMCERCHSFLGELDRIEIVEAPVLLRGGDEEEEA